MTSTSYLRPGGVRSGDEPGDEFATRAPRRRRLVLAAAVAVVVALVLAWVIAFSPVFGVRSVEVAGNRTLTAAQVRAAAGIDAGTPLVRLDTAAVTRRVERLPDVASAQVSTSFPSTVSITITERRAVGFVRAGGQDHLVDSTGAQYHVVATAPKTLPRFVLPTGAAARGTGAAVATVAAALPSAVLARVSSIQAIDAASITLVLRGGLIVQWGTSARSADKARVLPTLLKLKPSHIDLTDADQPVTR